MMNGVHQGSDFELNSRIDTRIFFESYVLDDLADGKDYASLKREAEDRSMWRVRK